MNRLARPRPGPPPAQGWLVCLCLAAAVGCDRNDIRVYTIPKEQATAVAAAHGHGTAPARITWQAPAGWEEGQPGRMRVARFAIRGKDGQVAEVGIMPLVGVSASKADILNLWRGEIRLEPISADALAGLAQKVEVGPWPAELFDMVSTNALIDDKFRTRVLVAMLQQDQTLWLFKIAGADDLVREQRPAFLQFLKSIAFYEDTEATARPPRLASTNDREAPSAGKPQWEVPPGWQEQPPGQMVLAKFALPGSDGAKAEVTVSSFPGDAGGPLANVNRWRGQVSLEPVDASQLDRLLTQLEVAGRKAMLFDMTGLDRKTGQRARLIGVIVPSEGQTWFYKLMGHEQVAERQKEAFIKFVQSAKHPNA